MKKRYLFGIMLMMTLITSFNVSAWGPERPTYTNETPASKAVFNSITNNVAVGDEREFVRIREKGSGNVFTADTANDGFLVEPGKTYEIYIYYHNDAASNTNETGMGVATGVKLNTHFTSKVLPNESGYVNATITAQTDPAKVWDDIKLISEQEVTLRYVNHTATIHNDWAADGTLLTAEQLFSDDGSYLGVDILNGVVFGCAEYSGYVTYELKADDKENEPIVAPDCVTNPELPGCKELPNTGPVEIVMAVMIILGIGGGIFYLYRTRKTLNEVETAVSGKEDANHDDSSQKPDNMVE